MVLQVIQVVFLIGDEVQHVLYQTRQGRILLVFVDPRVQDVDDVQLNYLGNNLQHLNQHGVRQDIPRRL